MKYYHRWVPDIQACCHQSQYEIVKEVGNSSSARPSRYPCKSCWDCGQGHRECNTWNTWNKLEANNCEMKAWPNCTVNEHLNGGSWCSKLLEREDFAVWVSYEGEVGVNLLKYPAWSTTRESTVQAKFVFRMRQMVSQIISESKALSKLKRWDPPNVDMILVSKLNPKEMLEHVCIWAGAKKCAEASSGNDSRAG